MVVEKLNLSFSTTAQGIPLRDGGSVRNNVRLAAAIGKIINLSFFISAGRRQDPVLESVLVRRTGGVSGLTQDDFAPKSPPFAISPVSVSYTHLTLPTKA